MIQVVCLKWGDKFSPAYVNNLYAGLCEFTETTEFQFHCFTDDDSGIHRGVRCHALPQLDITGWWYKLWLFSDELPFDQGERVMFFDLDTLITGNIDAILSDPCEKDLIGLRNLAYPSRGFASGLLMWKHGTQTHVWEKFCADPAAAQAASPDGDQEWTKNNAKQYEYWQDLYTGIYSYKVHCKNGLPDDAAIVCYHGTPSIVQSYTETVTNYDGVWPPQEWVKDYWSVGT